jgi:hypothetical protein
MTVCPIAVILVTSFGGVVMGLPCVVVEFRIDSGNVWKAHAVGVDWQGGRWAVERMEGQRVDLGAPEAESRDEVEAEQVAAVRPEGVPGPAGSRREQLAPAAIGGS